MDLQKIDRRVCALEDGTDPRRLEPLAVAPASYGPRVARRGVWRALPFRRRAAPRRRAALPDVIRV